MFLNAKKYYIEVYHKRLLKCKFFVNLIKKSFTKRHWQDGKIDPYFLRRSAGFL